MVRDRDDAISNRSPEGTCVSRLALVMVLLPMFGGLARAQPCNPVLDGTYCAEESSRRSNLSASPERFAPIRNLGEAFSSGPDQPATLGAITFGGNGSRCVGLLRRGRCD